MTGQAPGWSDLGPYPRDSASQARELHALLQAAGVPPPYVLVAESSAALDARVYANLWPADVAGVVFVNGVHPDLLDRIRPGARRRASIPAFANRSEDAMAQMFNQFGLYQLGLPNQPAPAPIPKGITSSQWNTIWHLTQSAKGRSALIQETAAWQRSASQASAAGSLGNRPLIVLSAENTFVASQFPSVWKELQTDLSRLSTQGKQTAVDLSSGELIYQSPDAIIEATREVVAEVRQGPQVHAASAAFIRVQRTRLKSRVPGVQLIRHRRDPVAMQIQCKYGRLLDFFESQRASFRPRQSRRIPPGE